MAKSSVRVSKVLAVLATALCTYCGSIAAATNMDIMIIQDILKYDHASRLPFFKKMEISGCKKRYR
jgi:hypothetical protein